jgi:DNA-binding NarL/FixJ family response regulator
MAQGRSNRAICERLFLSPKTVGTHVGSIFAKLGLLPAADDHRRVLAVLMYLRANPTMTLVDVVPSGPGLLDNIDQRLS